MIHWFSSSYLEDDVLPAITEKQKDYMEQEIEMKMQEEKRREEIFLLNLMIFIKKCMRLPQRIIIQLFT